MPQDKLSGAIEKVGTKKAKAKTLEEEPLGTKAKKLPSDVLAAMETSFPKAKMRHVRVHFGGNATEIAKTLRAKSFTIGTDIYLAKKSDSANSELLAHELTHVVQQGNGKMPKPQSGKALTSK